MVSLCLTKPRIDGRISAVSEDSEEAQQLQGRAGRTTLSGDNNVSDDRPIQQAADSSIESSENVYLADKQHLPLLSQANSGPFDTGVGQHLKQQKRFISDHSQIAVPEKSESPLKSSVIDRKLSFIGSDTSSIERRNSMLATIKAMGGPQNQRSSVYKSKRNLQYYSGHLVDAKKDKYRVHKWRLKSGRILQSNASLMSSNALKSQQKTQRRKDESTRKLQNQDKDYLPELLRNVESRYLPKTDPAELLKIALEAKERMFQLQKPEKVDIKKKTEIKARPFLARLRHHIKAANEGISVHRHFTENADRIPSSLFSSPENIIKSSCGNFNTLPDPLASDLPTRTLTDHVMPLTSQFASKLPPIAPERRRQSYPTRQNPKAKDYKSGNIRTIRSSSLLPGIGTTTSIPENEPVAQRGLLADQQNFSDKLHFLQEKVTMEYKTSKGAEPALGGSPTNKKSHSSMTMASVGGTTRSSSKEGKEGDTPTDSEGSHGASWHRRKLRRGSRMLAKMESRSSPQAFRYIKPSRMDALMRQWYLYAKSAIWMARLCKSHHVIVDDSYNIQSGPNKTEEAAESANKKEVLFDVTDYKMKNQLRLSDTTRRILSLPTEKRTEKDINLVQTALRNIKAISAYSNAVQQQIGRQGYFVGFEGKRVVVREGRRPFNYYLLLAGSAVVIKSDESGNTNPVLFMKRGDVFGENEILEDTKWQWSVATSGYCEFLLLERDAYQSIFITGGGGGLLSDPDRGGFLRSISLLQQWPIEILNENPNRCLFRYFKRGALLASDNTTSEWIYVVKSGSCSVLKKLMVEKQSDKEIMKKTRKEQKFVSDISAKPHLVEETEAIDKEDHITLLAQKEQAQQKKYVGVLQQLEMSSILKELNPDVVGDSVSPRAEAGFDDFRSEIPLSSYKAVGPVDRNGEREKENPSPSSDNKSKYVQEDAFGNFRMSRHSDRYPPRTPSPTKAAYLRTGVSSRQTGRESDEDGKKDQNSGGPPEIVITDTSDSNKVERSPLISPQKQVHINEYLFGMNTPAEAEEHNEEKQLLHPVHVNVRRLTKRDSFGIGPHLYSNQPSLALVSNGAECLMLNKKFFLENASEDCMKSLGETEYPYPSDDELMEQHWRLMSWNAYQAKTIQEITNKTSVI